MANSARLEEEGGDGSRSIPLRSPAHRRNVTSACGRLYAAIEEENERIPVSAVGFRTSAIHCSRPLTESRTSTPPAHRWPRGMVCLKLLNISRKTGILNCLSIKYNYINTYIIIF